MEIQTERLILRPFHHNDWRDLQEIALSNAASEFSDCDTQWPTDDEGIQAACDYFSSESQFWAIEVMDIKKVVCFINFNSISESGSLDVGHVINSAYLHMGYELEALTALFEYTFKELNIGRITSTWALEDREKLTPLKQLGMQIADTFQANKFGPDSNGAVSQFTACRLHITKEDWSIKKGRSEYAFGKPERRHSDHLGHFCCPAR